MKQLLVAALLCVVVSAAASSKFLRAHPVDKPSTSTVADTASVDTVAVLLLAADDDFGPWEVVAYDSISASPSETAVDIISEPAVALLTADTIPIEIMGESIVDAEKAYNFILRRNPGFSREIAEAYIEVGRRYGIRGDMALCQAIVETGWFLFEGGTAVTPDQHNYCGLGVTRRGLRGHSFPTVEQGVTAQLQHLYAYATKAPLPDGEQLIDPRFGKVSRGCAPTWHDLSNRWAANDRYGRQILDLYRKLLQWNADCLMPISEL